MAVDVAGLVERMGRDGAFVRVINNPFTQFGTPQRNYLGATILPERPVTENQYSDQGIKYRTLIANAGTRYSPSQKKGGVLTGSFDVKLGHSDIASEFTAQEYDSLLLILSRIQDGKIPMEAFINVMKWVDATLSRPLVEHNEKNIWASIVAASVVLTGDDGYTETVSYSNPSGHRVAAAGLWSNNAYDPYNDIMAGVAQLYAKGYPVSRIFAGRSVINLLSTNALIRQRVGRLSITGGIVTGLSGRASLTDINNMLSDDNLPPIEEYNLQYRTSTSSGYFLARNVFVMVADTGQEETVDFGDQQRLLNGVLGYTAIGRPAGQMTPGRRIRVATFDNKPPRIEGEAWQASIPVVEEPEAIYVINSIA